MKKIVGTIQSASSYPRALEFKIDDLSEKIDVLARIVMTLVESSDRTEHTTEDIRETLELHDQRFLTIDRRFESLEEKMDSQFTSLKEDIDVLSSDMLKLLGEKRRLKRA